MWQAPFRRRLTPASTERLVKLNHAQQLVETNLRQTELCLEQVPIGVERIELCIDAASITHVSQARPILQRSNQRLLLEAAFSHPLMSDQRVRNVGERRLNALLVLDESAFPLRFGKFHAGFQSARSKNRLRNLR